MTDSVDNFARVSEGISGSELEEIVGPVVLKPECLSELDAAIDVAGFMPIDLQSVDANLLQNEFLLLNQANDWQARKAVFKHIVELMRASQ